MTASPTARQLRLPSSGALSRRTSSVRWISSTRWGRWPRRRATTRISGSPATEMYSWCCTRTKSAGSLQPLPWPCHQLHHPTPAASARASAISIGACTQTSTMVVWPGRGRSGDEWTTLGVKCPLRSSTHRQTSPGCLMEVADCYCEHPLRFPLQQPPLVGEGHIGALSDLAEPAELDRHELPESAELLLLRHPGAVTCSAVTCSRSREAP